MSRDPDGNRVPSADIAKPMSDDARSGGAITPVILCGGSGTRLWPRSRKERPKPFLPLVGELTLFEATLARCADAALFSASLIVAGEAHLAHIRDQSAQVREVSIIVEPQAKNTAPAIALAAARLPPEAVMLVCPSDHHIADQAAFREAAATAASLARDDWMVAFGIEATAPETGYGYIQRGEPLGAGFRIERFVEKPDLEAAIRFLADRRYSWNGGIFALRAGAFLDELARHRPAMHAAVIGSVEAGREDGAAFHPEADLFASIDGESIDYAVMENTSCAAMVPAAMRWSDIGNWHALRDAREPSDANGNRVRGRAELIDCRGVLVESDGPRVSVIGLSDVSVIVDGGEVVVASMEGAQKVGKLTGAAEQ